MFRYGPEKTGNKKEEGSQNPPEALWPWRCLAKGDYFTRCESVCLEVRFECAAMTL